MGLLSEYGRRARFLAHPGGRGIVRREAGQTRGLEDVERADNGRAGRGAALPGMRAAQQPAEALPLPSV